MEQPTTTTLRTTRRALLKQMLALSGVSAGAALLNACGSQAATATAVPATVQQPPAVAGTTVAPAANAAPTIGVAATTMTEATAAATAPAATASASTTSNATPAIVAAANAFLATLDATKRTAVSFTYPTDQKTATAANFGFRVGEQFGTAVWSNYPISDVIRPGIKMGDLTDTQRQAALAILSTTLSTQGYSKVLNIMQADQVLADSGTNYAAGTSNYVLGIFGTPSESTRWMIQFGGHHLGVNVTIQGAAMTIAPMLTGCQPSSYTSGGQTIRPLGAETDKAFALINALDAAQQAQAILSYSVTDLVLGPGHDGQVLQPEGIPAASLKTDQQAQLLDLVGEWVNVLNDITAQARIAEIRTHLAETYFAWSGATTAGSSIYFRITGPTLHIEYADQGGGPGGGPGGVPSSTAAGAPNGTPSSSAGNGQDSSVQAGGANHIHTVYRDPTNEYGAKLS